ncbi:helicase [Salmonella enterica subsp. enterica]|nr:helicase [Salmonella enterica subsp. enterica]
MKKSGQDERETPVLRILAPEWDDAPRENWLSSAMRNSAYVYPDHGRMWLTQRILREQGTIRMPQSARLLIESVYGEDVNMPVGFAKTEQLQKGKFYCDRAFARQMLLNFAPGYCAELAILYRRKCQRGWRKSLSRCGWRKSWDGVVTPYASGEHAWEMSVLRVRQSWWDKHKGEFERLDGEPLRKWCAQQHQDKDFATGDCGDGLCRLWLFGE